MRRWLVVALVSGSTAAQAGDPTATRIGRTPLVDTAPTALDRTFVERPALAALGRVLFEDTDLSAPRGLACASCHVASRGLASGRVARFGVAEGSVPGRLGARTVPPLRYARYTPPLRFFSDPSDDDATPQPRVGLFVDGRVDRMADVSRVPLFNPVEMNNRSAAAVAGKLRRAVYAPQLRAAFGDHVFDDPARAVRAFGDALAAYLESDALSPFSSRYDAFIAQRGTLTPLEVRGMRLFRDPTKGNCAGCHAFNPDSSDPRRSMFTDYGYDAIGAPRNDALPHAKDLGLCATAVRDAWPDPGQWCGYYRTPSLRNVAVRARYLHNGVFDDLTTLVAFYATRATDPKRWYPRGVAFDDLPRRYRVNINVSASPWNRKPGAPPGLDASEIDAIVAFLRTLTDRDLESGTARAAAPLGGPPGD